MQSPRKKERRVNDVRMCHSWSGSNNHTILVIFFQHKYFEKTGTTSMKGVLEFGILIIVTFSTIAVKS